MDSKTLRALNLITIICAFLLVEAPRYIKMLAPYPRACAFVGVALGVISSFSRFLNLLKAFLMPYSSSNDKDNPSAPLPPSIAALVLIGTLFLLGVRVG
jgi:hypothetical protein